MAMHYSTVCAEDGPQVEEANRTAAVDGVFVEKSYIDCYRGTCEFWPNEGFVRKPGS